MIAPLMGRALLIASWQFLLFCLDFLEGLMGYLGRRGTIVRSRDTYPRHYPRSFRSR